MSISSPAPSANSPLTPDEEERFEERAFIAEYDGRLPRSEAEAVALAEIVARRGEGGRT